MTRGSPGPGSGAAPGVGPGSPAGPGPVPTSATAPDLGEQMLEELLSKVHTAAPMELPALVDRCAAMIGVQRVVIYLVDLQQRHLMPLTPGLPPVLVSSPGAGLTYRTFDLRIEEAPGGGLVAWLPLVDGAERLGILEAAMESVDPARLRRCRMMASALSMAITSKRAYSDSFARRTRTESMDLPAELLRSLLPPRTIGSDRAISTAVLEPAYHIGGDAFDHALTRSTLHAALFDAMGHNLASGLTTTVAVAGCRNARRSGADLPRLVGTIDGALGAWLPDQYCTGVVAQLDLASGAFRWCNCGHPAPLLIRRRQVLHGALERPAQPPMGMPAQLVHAPRTAYETTLQPGDRVLFYTDGVTEARLEGGEEFGVERFTDSIIRAAAAGELAPEALRRIIHAILDRQGDRLRDDATLLFIEWRPPRP